MNNNFNFQIQAKTKEDFDILKKFAEYSSVRTMVLEIHNLKTAEINKEYPGLLNKYFEIEEDIDNIPEENKPFVYFKNNKAYIGNGTNEIYSYLDIWTSVNPYVKISNYRELFTLISAGFLRMDESFEKLMTPMDENSPLTDLISSKGKIKHMGAQFSLGKLGLNIKDLDFDNCKVVKKRVFIKKNMVVKEFDGVKKIGEALTDEGLPIRLKFFSLTPVQINILKPGRKFSMIVHKIFGNDLNGYEIQSGIFVPNGFILKEIKTLKCHRKYPVAYYNAAYYEYEFRKNRGVS